MIDPNLGTALSRFTCPNSPSFDSQFDVLVRAQFPHWFVDTASKNKAELLALPAGSPRPVSGKHPLGSRLSSYTSPSRNTYDPIFDAAVREKFPHWFMDTASKNKAELLALPAGSPRPARRNGDLGRALSNYLNKSHGTYDADFERKIRERFPHWFVEKTVDQKKLNFWRCRLVRRAHIKQSTRWVLR